MQLDKKQSLIAILAGIDGALALLFLVGILGITHPTTNNIWILIPFIIIVAGLLEEGTKFLLIRKFRKWGDFPYYAILLGFGYAITEQYIRYAIFYIADFKFEVFLTLGFWLDPLVVVCMQTYTAFLMALSIKNGYPIMGLILAIMLHSFYDILVNIF